MTDKVSREGDLVNIPPDDRIDPEELLTIW